MLDISKQHCGVHHSTYETMLELMPDIKDIINTFPDDPRYFTWDVKVHMLMPRQYPCIPNWHYDNVPRIGGVQRFDRCDYTKPMYLWLSNAPLTQFRHGYVEPETWVRFTQQDEHRGTASGGFCWRMFIRATHIDILKPKYEDNLRRHCQVYLDADTYQW